MRCDNPPPQRELSSGRFKSREIDTGPRCRHLNQVKGSAQRRSSRAKLRPDVVYDVDWVADQLRSLSTNCDAETAIDHMLSIWISLQHALSLSPSRPIAHQNLIRSCSLSTKGNRRERISWKDTRITATPQATD